MTTLLQSTLQPDPRGDRGTARVARQSTRRGIAVSLSLMALTAATATFADIAQDEALAQAQARHRLDMAFCDSAQSYQGLRTCRLEARNALAEAKRGGLNDAPEQYARNVLLRCAVFQGDDLKACRARLLGPARVEGSIEGGGVLRESVMVVPAK